jgi:hypothetical protein
MRCVSSNELRQSLLARIIYSERTIVSKETNRNTVDAIEFDDGSC